MEKARRLAKQVVEEAHQYELVVVEQRAQRVLEETG
jgi:hypothetical protein